MSGEWIRFAVTAALLFVAMVSFSAAVIGAYRFGFVLNRIHAAGIGDTAGVFFVILSLLISAGSGLDTVKLILIVLFLWFTSPASSHFVSQVEYYTNPHLFRYVDRQMKEPED
ncbi:MAG: monovalent cation/H(+) antiporter subunit G [Clostridiales bacterium]|nr:monovalent cation/H(+) antiporter subunit G [Clostridiales bacterium]